jgi:hypothetical protein
VPESEILHEGDDELDELVQRADLDGLVRLVDNRTAAGDWTGLRRARDRSRAAIATGRQLWPAATLAEYRLALVAPAEWAAPIVADDAGMFTIGPLTEVIAQHHTWSQLAPLLPPAPGTAVVAHERVLRGEQPEPASVAGLPNVIDMPFGIAAWEPRYPLATYGDGGVDAPAPTVPETRGERRSLPSRDAELIDDDEVDLAVRQLVETWTASSNGHAEITSAAGGVDAAIGALGLLQWQRAEISCAEALAWLGWAGASGGAHGRRRGAALGRFGALWVLAALLHRLDEWPAPLAELGREAAALRWYWWDAGEPPSGWRLQLAVEHRDDGIAWAINALDDASSVHPSNRARPARSAAAQTADGRRRAQ